MDCTYTTQTLPVSDGQTVSRRGVAKRCSSPPRADSVVSMLRSLSLDDDFFERRALRATCIQKTPLDDFHPQASEIVPGLFVCDIYTATSPAVVRGLGITHVASVIKHDCPRFPKPMQHVWVPIDDSRQAELLGHLDFVVEWIAQALEQKGQVMVHCVWGMSRSASVVIAYLMAVEKMPFDIACKHVISRRKVVRPNSAFMRQLKAYEQILRSRGQRRHSV
ncbi:phosphatases II [Laetiporus sulphureus 93-53]|uniref:Phosphatases II n=1 Tax=Laetiporus sulphureus 93-53 TaxID=1314785 RepID=A0A165DDQ5_9APHY|nr:phosphatases II [Laetiporus sulphureus 93-53]KZT04653.1 phosphatases II [Laetiporus sulphureus 93-53]